MASLTTYNFTQLVSNIATAVQAASQTLIDFTVGSVERAIVQATSAVLLWLQGMVLTLLTLTRAATSVESDLDSWWADFGFTREPAVGATGQVTFARFTATLQAVVPINASVQTADGTEQFIVVIDTTNTAYNATLGGYVLAPSVSSVNVPVQAVTAGSDANVLAGAISVLTSAISGVDTVTNASAFTNGVDAESDAAGRGRFVLYLASLSKATKIAISYAIASVQQGIINTLTENADYNGTVDYGYFWVAVDDGSGTPSSQLLNNVGSAVENVRGLAIRYGVFAPVILTANVGMTITSGSGYVHSAVVGAVGIALENAINSLKLGNALPYTQLAAIAYSVPGVINVTAVLLNSGTSDMTATLAQVIKSGTISVA